MKLTAKTMKGLESVLAQELADLGATNIEIGNRAVMFEGDQKVMYRANYECRTALAILKPLADFQIRTQEDLYTKVVGMAWEKQFCVDSKMLVDSFCLDSVFTHTKYVSQRTKDAICDHFRSLFHKRPFVDMENPDVKIDVYLYKNRCVISMNSSGELLHRRNYRIQANQAPINEVLAAGLIALSGWDTQTDFYDPMCGSGTLLIEAAMKACNMPAQFYRKKFAFQHWNDFDTLLWKQVQDEATANIGDPECEIFGSDISEENLYIAEQNIRQSRLHKDINLRLGDFLKLESPSEKGIIVTNPPYGVRLAVEDLIEMYKNIGDKLKTDYKNWTAWFISSDVDAMKNFGLHPSKKIELYNGALLCKFQKFELYEGSRKKSKS
ncbi:MAG: THUMP domain-containing protein [Bacteroidales bacterium]|jgi:putative N6-adenine-specific DNA methylase|nr:THUMP domain-containing protein [Bacteroidales bacterium]